MSKLLEPFTNFIRSIGIDPLIFAVLLAGFFAIGTFIAVRKKWGKLEKRERVDVILMWIGFLTLLIMLLLGI